MNRGPQAGKARNGATDLTFVEKADEAFGGAAPDWIVALAQLADSSGLDAAGAAIGYSGSAVSTVLRNRYAGDVERVAEKARGALLGAVVICPVIGEMTRDTCLDWQQKPKAATSAYRMRMYHACRNNCPHFRTKGASNGTE